MNGGLRDTPRSVAKDSQLRSIADADGTIDRAALAAYIERSLPTVRCYHRAVIAQGSALALFPLLDTERRSPAFARPSWARPKSSCRQRDFDDDGVITGVRADSRSQRHRRGGRSGQRPSASLTTPTTGPVLVRSTHDDVPSRSPSGC